MKYAFFLALVSFVFIAVLSFTALDHGSDFSKCVAAVLPMNCYSDVHMGIAHAEIYHSFSLALLITTILALIALAASSTLNTNNVFHFFIRSEFAAIPSVVRKLLDWQIILQKRDPQVI